MSDTAELPPNFTKVKHNVYIVRTQAGFRQALKSWNPYWREYDDVRGYPTSYPAVVSFYSGYAGHDFVDCISVPLNQLRSAMEGQ